MTTNPHQVYGTAIIIPTGGLTLAWTGTIRNTVTLVTQALSADATLTAGTYSPTDFMNHAAKKMRESIYAEMQTFPVFFTTLPATTTTVPFKVGLQAAGPSVTPGGTLLRVECATTGGALAGAGANPTDWTAFSIVNTSAPNWALLGMARISETRALTVSAGGFADDGRFQPRWLFVYRSYFRDTGNLRRWPSKTTEVYDDGTAAQYDFGTRNIFERDLTLVDQPQHIVGVPWHVGRFSAFGATRNLLQLLEVTESFFTSSISGTIKNLTNVTSPVYLRCNQWWARYYQESPTNTLGCFDVWPAAVVPTAGEPVWAMPESEAMIEEARRVGLLFRFAPIDSTGETSWTSEAYAFRTGANPRPQRRNSGNLFYSLDLPLMLVPNPELATP